MNSLSRIVFIVFYLSVLSGCASTQMTDVLERNRILKPDPDKALVIFLRPSYFGGAIQSVIYDGDTYIGTLSAGKQIAYETTPGEHMFMVVSEAADFMQANLAAEKTYYSVVVSRPGLFRARFSFMPQNGQIQQEKLEQWLASTTQVIVNEKGRIWAENNAESVAQKKAEFLPKWKSKLEERKQTLLIGSGR